MKTIFAFISLFINSILPLHSQTDPFKPDFSAPKTLPGMTLVWNDEFNRNGIPDSSVWSYEKGFVRNQELQWYQPQNVSCKSGILLIEGRKEKSKNPDYVAGSPDWKRNREYIDYTSASINTRTKKQFRYGVFVIRARIDTAKGAWPAIWTLGVTKPWPSNGETDVMEFYRVKNVPTILANYAWGTTERYRAKWDDMKIPLSEFTKNDPEWVKKFHIWKMDWNEDSISIYLDDKLLNSTILKETINPDGFNPFTQPHYLLLNLALGGNGGDPSKSKFPIKYEVDYVRVYQGNNQ